MSGIAAYERAKAIQDYLSAGNRDVVRLMPIDDGGKVGVSLNLRDPSHFRFTWEHFDVDLARLICVDIFDKLGPAVQALFNRYLAEHIEQRRKDAIEYAERKRADDELKWAKELLKLGVEYDPGEYEGALCCRNGCDGVLAASEDNATISCPKCGWTSKEDE